MKNIKIIGYFVNHIWKSRKQFFLLVILSGAIQTLSAWILALSNKLLFDGLECRDMTKLWSGVIFVAAGTFICNAFQKITDCRIEMCNLKLVEYFEEILGQKISGLSYEKLENSAVLEMRDKAVDVLSQRNMVRTLIKAIKSFCAGIVTLVGIGSLIAYLNPLLVLLIAAVVFLNSFLNYKAKKAQQNFWKKIMPINRRLQYYRKLANDHKMGKDVRIYQMQDYILGKIEGFDRECYDGFKNLYKKTGVCRGGVSAAVCLQLMMIYFYVLYLYFKDLITLGSFTMYVSASQTFAGNITNAISCYLNIKECCGYLEEYCKFMQLDEMPAGGVPWIDREIRELEFEQVSFKYENQKEFTLKNVSFKIKCNEHVAMVGENGAGKTTIVKLICRFYKPTQGRILINGTDIWEYDYDEYCSLITAVFQDYRIFSLSVKDNIEVMNQNKQLLDKVLKNIDLRDKIESLPCGEETVLDKKFHKNGIELSGGESQKIAIARALYKNSPFVIMDEPTSALDPVSEHKLYQGINVSVRDKMVLFISHRMSVCRFCNRILVLENGRVAGYDNHDNLIENNALYQRMWNAQAEFYK